VDYAIGRNGSPSSENIKKDRENTMPKKKHPSNDEIKRLMPSDDISKNDDENPIEILDSEKEDAESTSSHYEIVSIPADFTLEGLVSKLNKKQLVIPGFQRKYVWSQRQASRLVESFLLGLPVPALFLYADTETGELQVIDGQQRLTSIKQFFDGAFQNANMAKAKIFTLTGLAEDSIYAGKTAKQLREESPATFEKLNDSVMRAFMIKQLDPHDATSVYHIFERLNTGGTVLQGQEIRNCVYHGRLNDLINELNQIQDWRKILGKERGDPRMRDVEMILRFISLYFYESEYKKPMKDFLSWAMKKKRNLPSEEVADLRMVFIQTCYKVVSSLGEMPFHMESSKMNPAVFDAVFTVAAGIEGDFARDFKERFYKLIASDVFKKNSSYRTTDINEVKQRLHLARQFLTDAT
jgi:hypothetical protein